MSKYLILFAVLYVFIFTNYSYSQIPSAETLKNNIKQKIFKVNRQDNYEDIYADLNNNSFIRIPNYYTGSNTKEEEFVVFDYSVYSGSFLNPNNKEYLLFVRLADDNYCSFFGHSENNGNTTFIYIFNNDYKQISEVFFQDAPTHLIDIVDLDNDGLSEVIMESSYSQQGCSESWIQIFKKDFNNSLLRVVNYHSCLLSGYKGEKILLESDYKIIGNKIVFNSKLDYYLCLGIEENKDYEPINRFLKTEYKIDEFVFENNKFLHIKDINNVDWDLEQLMF